MIDRIIKIVTDDFLAILIAEKKCFYHKDITHNLNLCRECKSRADGINDYRESLLDELKNIKEKK